MDHNCKHCYDQKGNLGSLGRFDEYPRAKVGLFDPRKIGQPWPEPHPDPLIPYVRANEGLLPYEKYNEFQNRRNSMQGWNETLGGVAEINTASSAISEMMSALTSPDFAFDYLRQNLDNKEYDRFWYINPQGQKVETQRIPEEKTFFAFVPAKNPSSENYMFMIRCGGPENKVCYYNEEQEKVVVDSAERSYLRVCFDNLMTANIGNPQANQMLQNLAHQYPIVFDAKNCAFFSSDITAKNNEAGKASYKSRFTYAGEMQAFESMAAHILDHIVNGAVEHINRNSPLSDQMKKFMLLFLGACLKGTLVLDVSEGISKAIVAQLKKDFAIARRRAQITFEPEVVGMTDKLYKGDYGSFTAFSFVNDAKLKDGFDELLADLKGAIASVIRQRRSAFGQMYQQILGMTELRQQAAENVQQQQDLTQAQQQIEQLEKDKEAIRQAGMQSIANISKEYAAKVEELQARAKELESKDRELSTLRSKTQELTQQVSRPKSDSDSTTATALAGVFAVSTIALAYMHFVKK